MRFVSRGVSAPLSRAIARVVASRRRERAPISSPSSSSSSSASRTLARVAMSASRVASSRIAVRSFPSAWIYRRLRAHCVVSRRHESARDAMLFHEKPSAIVHNDSFVYPHTALNEITYGVFARIASSRDAMKVRAMRCYFMKSRPRSYTTIRSFTRTRR
jgi:hypothetical protein